MSRFYASISGRAHTEATREGTEKSGIHSHTRGWGLGVQVHGYPEGKTDVFVIEITGGSGGGANEQLIATVKLDPESADPEVETFLPGQVTIPKELVKSFLNHEDVNGSELVDLVGKQLHKNAKGGR